MSFRKTFCYKAFYLVAGTSRDYLLAGLMATIFCAPTAPGKPETVLNKTCIVINGKEEIFSFYCHALS